MGLYQRLSAEQQNELYHHGVKNQKWGDRKVPWYPIADYLSAKKRGATDRVEPGKKTSGNNGSSHNSTTSKDESSDAESNEIKNFKKNFKEENFKEELTLELLDDPDCPDYLSIDDFEAMRDMMSVESMKVGKDKVNITIDGGLLGTIEAEVDIKNHSPKNIKWYGA